MRTLAHSKRFVKANILKKAWLLNNIFYKASSAKTLNESCFLNDTISPNKCGFNFAWALRVKGDDYEQNWIDPIIGLLRDSDNVYTDISYNYLPNTVYAQKYKRLLLEKIDGVEHKILFGTDWYMSRMLCGLEKFCESYEELLPDLYTKAAGENAVTFLKSDASTIFFPQFFERNNGTLETEYRQLFVQWLFESGLSLANARFRVQFWPICTKASWTSLQKSSTKGRSWL